MRHFLIAGDADHGHSIAIAHALGGDGFAGVDVEHGDQIGDGDADFAVDAHHQMLILEAQLKASDPRTRRSRP